MLIKVNYDRVRNKMSKFLKADGRMPIGVAQLFVSESTWWHDHPKGPVRAPNYANHVSNGPHGWEVKFGANYFLVELAVRGCLSSIEFLLNDAERKSCGIDRLTLDLLFFAEIPSSVANFGGHIYEGGYDMADGVMRFGIMGINVHDFVRLVKEKTGVNEILSKY